MFDEYVPQPTIRCPRCGSRVSGWQGKDGPCLSLVWRQGQPIDPAALERARLPAQFHINATCASCGDWIEAVGEAEEGVWVRTRVQGSLGAR